MLPTQHPQPLAAASHRRTLRLPRLSRLCALVVLGAGLLNLGGCLGSILGAIFDPTGVAAGGAQAVGNSAPSSLPAGATPIPDNDLGSASDDLQRIMTENPSAGNRPELMALQQQLQNGPSYRRRLNSVNDEPDRKAMWDRRSRRSHGFEPDRIGVDWPEPIRRPGQDWALPTAPGEMVTPEPVPAYQMSLTPVRLGEQNPDFPDAK